MDEQERAVQLELVNRGDADALQRLIVQYHAPLRRALETRIAAECPGRVDPDDVLQQAYISAFKALSDTGGTGAAADAPHPPGGRGSRRATLAGAPPADQNRARHQSPDRKGGVSARGQSPDRDQSPDRKEGVNSAPRFDNPGHFYKWLESIALHRLQDAQRALQRQKRDVRREVGRRPGTTTSYPDLVQRLAASDSTPSRQIAEEEAIAAVMSCLARLTDDQRAVVCLRFLEGRPVAEVAERLGRSEAAIHMLCHRGLKSLRALMVSITHYLTRL